MKHQLNNDQVIYSFGASHAPVLQITSGDTVAISTCDCFSDQLSETCPFDALDWNKINPATGPIYITDALPGDILKVVIEDIELADHGIMAVGPDLGVLGKRIPQFAAKSIPIKGNNAIFNDDYLIPLNPMIGVIGVAPKTGEIACGIPDTHGGNMDNKKITKGATLYLPVFVEGALFALGDLHAAMGDGEIGISGVEIAGTVTVTLSVIKGHRISAPMLEDAQQIFTIASKKTLDEAVHASVEQMLDFLLPRTNLTVSELTMLLSATGQTEICQVVDPLLTARFAINKSQYPKLTLF